MTLALLAGGSALARTEAPGVPGTTLVDHTDGFAITIPTAWKLVPRSRAALEAEIAALRKSKSKSNHELAQTFASIAATHAGLVGLTAYKLQAIAWPPNPDTPLLTEVSVGIVKAPRAYSAAALAAVADTYANAFATNKGSKVTVPKALRLPAGKAELIEATFPAGQGLSNGIELYLIPHGKRLFELSFEIDARGLRQATLFASIASLFAFVA